MAGGRPGSERVIWPLEGFFRLLNSACRSSTCDVLVPRAGLRESAAPLLSSVETYLNLQLARLLGNIINPLGIWRRFGNRNDHSYSLMDFDFPVNTKQGIRNK